MNRSLFAVLTAFFFCLNGLPFAAAQEGDAAAPADAPAEQSEQVNVDAGGGSAAAEEEEDTATVQGKTTLWTLIKSGGWAMFILGAFSLGLVALVIYNIIDLKPANFYPDDVYHGLEDDVQNADVESAMQRTQGSPTCLGQIIFGAMDYVVHRGYGVLDGEHLDNLMADASRSFNRNRARTINYFSVLAQASPMVGLLGTVSGMIKAFGTLGREGMGDPSRLAGNISEALVTTASGLIIAIPCIFCYFLFRDRLSNLVYEADEKASHLMNVFRNAVYVSVEGGEALPVATAVEEKTEAEG